MAGEPRSHSAPPLSVSSICPKGVDYYITRPYTVDIITKEEREMGMSSYILDLEEQFDEKIESAIKQSEHVDEAVAEAMKHRDLVAHLSDDEVTEMVYEGWNEIWSDYL